VKNSEPVFEKAGKRTDARLTPTLEKKLFTYAAAASAAGVGMLASPPAADAKVVYTPVNTAIESGFALDLNQDGLLDYSIVHARAASIGGSLRISYLRVCHDPFNSGASHNCVSSTYDPNAANVVRENSSGAVVALPFGAPIGPGQKFGGAGGAPFLVDRVYYSRSSNTQQRWAGLWANNGAGVLNRYLGLKFQTDGKWHFGWARLTVKTTPKNGFTVVLTGYAYETTPNQGLRAGQTTGTADVPSMNSMSPLDDPKENHGPSLGSLACGWSGMSIWRREQIVSN
jgi:hypothetical protein